MMLANLRSWFAGNAFQGQGVVFKLLRFLNLMEDKAVKFSLTGAQMWVTTILNIHTQMVSNDHITMGIAAATNGGAMIAHGVKRIQILKTGGNSDGNDGPPPWTGEGT